MCICSVSLQSQYTSSDQFLRKKSIEKKYHHLKDFTRASMQFQKEIGRVEKTERRGEHAVSRDFHMIASF